MNILQINCVYGVGSTGNITRDLHQALLARGHRSAVLYGRGPLSADPHVARICPSWYGRAQGLAARVAGLPYGRCIRSTRHLLDRIHRIGPDVVHLQCLNGHFCNLYLLLEDLKQSGIPPSSPSMRNFPTPEAAATQAPCSGWKSTAASASGPLPRLPAFWETGQRPPGGVSGDL